MNRGEQKETTHRETSSASIGEGNAPVDVVEELAPLSILPLWVTGHAIGLPKPVLRKIVAEVSGILTPLPSGGAQQAQAHDA